MNDLIFYGALYLAFGLFFGIGHMVRCRRCQESFDGIGYKVMFLILSTVFQIPVILISVLMSLFDRCETREDNIS